MDVLLSSYMKDCVFYIVVGKHGTNGEVNRIFLNGGGLLNSFIFLIAIRL